MSERKKSGGLDYTPRAFPAARAPDGPAPGLEDKLAELGLVERTNAEPSEDASAGVNPDVNHGTKKRPSLDYTPRAFPSARAPDGPAPDLEDRLVAMGLAERTRTPSARADVRHDASDVPAQPPTRRERPAAPPPAEPLPRRERVTGPAQQARSPEPSQAPPTAASYRERDMVPSVPVFQSPPEPARRREPVLPPEPMRRSEKVSPPEPAARRVERAAPPPAPTLSPPTFTATPQPVYVVPAPGSFDAPANLQLEQTLTAASALPPVPPEAAPRPLPLAAESARPAPSRDLGAPAKAAPKPTRAARNAERLKSLPDKEERVRLSVRLVASVDEKLNDLAHLRGLDRNTAVSVAIVQDWVECFGLQVRQAGR